MSIRKRFSHLPIRWSLSVKGSSSRTLSEGTSGRFIPGRRPPGVATAILEESDSFAVIFNRELTLAYVNPVARTQARISGEDLTDPAFLAKAEEAFTSGLAKTYFPTRTDGDALRVHLVPLTKRFLAVLVDDVAEEQRVNAMRRDFIANVSHELKTPISAISLLAEAIEEGADDAEVVRHFSIQLRQQARRLGNLTRDIIQLSEAQPALNPEDRQLVNLRELAAQEIETHRTYADQRRISLELHLPEDQERPAFTWGFRSALGTVLDNLIANAIRHSPPDSTISVTMTFERSTLMMTVEDQGEGIPLEHQHRIFERFYRVDRSRSREGGGTGLGLSIAHHIMRGHGGGIDLWSRPGEGAQFTLTFPLVDPDQPESSVQKPKKSKRVKDSDERKNSAG